MAEPKAHPDRPRILAVLRPGEPGTKRLVAQYGDRLVCVRYLEDEARGKRYKSVEIIVEERDLKPRRPPAGGSEVYVKIAWEELNLREQVKQAGASWNKDLKLWKMKRAEALKLGLKDRVVDNPA